MPKFAQGRFEMKNVDKYVGKKTPLARSSWEFIFMKMLDEHPGVENGLVKAYRFLTEIH